jgi:protein-L-isoaspartate(D-aspartate) O-methyltransferase
LYLNEIDNYALARERMIHVLRTRYGIQSRNVLQAMSSVHRHLFISEALRYRAYENVSLPIGCNQTISKPSTIALMVQALGLTGHERVLEIGTGSGYQSAIIAQLADRLVTSERISELFQRARDTLLITLKYRNVLLWNNGNFRTIEGPFDAIIVAAGADILPTELFDKLKADGRLIIPLGNGGRQVIKRYIKKAGNKIDEEDLGEARFVPLRYH